MGWSHGNIKWDNLLLAKDEHGNIRIQFCDFSSSVQHERLMESSNMHNHERLTFNRNMDAALISRYIIGRINVYNGLPEGDFDELVKLDTLRDSLREFDRPQTSTESILDCK